MRRWVGTVSRHFICLKIPQSDWFVTWLIMRRIPETERFLRTSCYCLKRSHIRNCYHVAKMQKGDTKHPASPGIITQIYLCLSRYATRAVQCLKEEKDRWMSYKFSRSRASLSFQGAQLRFRRGYKQRRQRERKRKSKNNLEFAGLEPHPWQYCVAQHYRWTKMLRS